MYTESLLAKEKDATKEFANSLYADLTTVGLLVGLCPVDYVSGFTSRSNTHELMTYDTVKKDTPQFHQVTTWRSPTLDLSPRDPRADSLPPIFDSLQLGTFIYDTYHRLFEQEDSLTFQRMNQHNILKAIGASAIVHYTRESFVLLLKLIRDRLQISREHWMEVMDRFFLLHEADNSMPMDANNFNDLCVHLHLNGIHTTDQYRRPPQRIGRFAKWDNIPPVVRVILVVPRERVNSFNEDVKPVPTPPLFCDVLGKFSHNIFNGVHVAFGRVIPMGTEARPWATFEEDPAGWKGTSSLVVSFTMTSALLTDIEPPENLSVSLSVRSTVATAMLVQKLGIALNVFSAKLMDRSNVHVLPEQPLPTKSSHVPASPSAALAPEAIAATQLGRCGAITVEMDEDCELVDSLTCRVSVCAEEAKRLLSDRENIPQITQVSPSVMRVTLGTLSQDLLYPFPVIGSKYRVRIARTSLYIEV